MHWRGMPRLAAFAGLICGLVFFGISCSELQLLEPGTCGNFVIDPGEDCDGHPLEKNTTCAAVNQPHACRQVCKTSTECPSGWGCGLDGICRQSNGQYAQRGAAVPLATPNQMLAGDFDDDGVTDLLLLGHENTVGTRPARIAYFDAKTNTVDLRALNTNVFSPVLGEGDSDGGFLDIAFATQAGISLLRGSPTRDTSFSVFPYLNAPEGSPMRIIPIDAFSDGPGDELLVLIGEANGTMTLRTLPDMIGETLISLPFSFDALAGNVERGRFDKNALCDDLVFAQSGSRDVYLYSPCRNDGSSGWNTPAEPRKVSLPAGFTIDKGVGVADLDMDGQLDILIETNASPHLAWGMGTGSFQSDKLGGTPDMAGPYELPKQAMSEFPLALGDVNGDSKTDFLFPHRLIVSKNDTFTVAYDNIGDAWTTGTITDLNANGLPDVVAGSSQSTDCTFLNNAGNGVFNVATLSTEGTIAHLTTGDFDGDLIKDLAIVEAFPSSSNESKNVLKVGFGKMHGPPETLTSLGELDSTSQLASACVHNVPADDLAPDAIGDLIVVDQHELTNNESMTLLRHALLFRGNGSRVLYTSRPLLDETQHAVPVALTIAHFAGGAAEITSLGVNHDTGALNFWTIEGEEADIARSGKELPTGFHSSTNSSEVSFRYGAFIAAGDLNEDGTDEVVAVAPFGTITDGAALVIGDFNDVDDTFLPRNEQPFKARMTIDNRFALHDIDGDGHLDGVLSTGTNEEPGPLLAFWGDGMGNLDTTNPKVFDVPGGISGFACVPELVGCRLVVASPSGTYTSVVRSSRQFDLKAVPNLPPSTQIALGDFDTDGLVDIALQTEDGLVYYRSMPVNP